MNIHCFEEGVRNLIQTTDYLEVIAEAAAGEVAIELAVQLYPNVIVMDIRMTLINWIEATIIIKEKLPDIKILIVTML